MAHDVRRTLHTHAIILGTFLMPGAALAADYDMSELRSSHDWSGWSAGAFAGAGLVDSSVELTDVGGALLTYDVDNGLFLREAGQDDAGFLAGVTAGYDRQFGSFVLGARATAALLDVAASAEHSAVDPNPDPLFNGAITNSALATDWDALGTLEIVGGVAFDRVKLHVAGGLAVGSVENSVTIAVLPGGPTNITYTPEPWTVSDTSFGYTVGAGAAYAVSERTTLNLDYNYVDLANTTVHVSDEATFPGQFLDYEFENDLQVVRAGLSVRF